MTSMMLSIFLSGLCMASRVYGTFDFFLSQDEVRKMDVVGWPGNFFYVENGNVNHNTVKYNFEVPYKMNSLTFSWRARDMANVTYAISSHALPGSESKLRALDFDIPRTGRIPARLARFSLRLACSPHPSAVLSAPAEFVIKLDVMVAGKVTDICLQRRKHCTELSALDTDIVVMTQQAGFGSEATFYVGLAALAALMMVAVGIGVGIAYCSRGWEVAHRPTGQSHYSSVEAVAPARTASPADSVPARPPTEPPSVAPPPSPVLEHLDVDCLQLEATLMEGTFGKICKGRLIKDEQDPLPVLVKLATEVASDTQTSVMLREAAAMTSLAHPNLLSAMGLVTDDADPGRPRVVYMYYHSVNLKRFLLQCRSGTDSWCRTLLTQELVHMAVQVLNALGHLHHHSLVHRDVAARNCVVDDQLRVKLCDMALSGDLFPADYYCLGDNENRPVGWLALEALTQRRFSAAADVWAFGVTFWELTTLAQQPYAEIDPFEMASYLREGYRLAQPTNCPDQLFAMMAYCWATEPAERPGLHHLQSCLIDFHMHLDNYV